MVVTGPTVDFAFEVNFFVVFEVVVCSRVLASCDDAVAAGSRLSHGVLGLSMLVDVVVALAFFLRAISWIQKQ